MEMDITEGENDDHFSSHAFLDIFCEETTMHDLECKILVAVLQNCMTQLNIVGQCIPVPIEECTVKYENLKKRFGSPEEKPKLGTGGIQISPRTQMLKKFQSKRTFLEGIIWNIMYELQHSKKFTFLLQTVKFLEKMQHEKESLEEMEVFNQNMVQKLQNNISDMQKNAELKLAEKLELIAKLQDKLTDEMMTRKVIQNFVRKWGKTQYDQFNWKNNQDLNSYTEKLMKAAKAVEDELKINENVIEHLTDSCDKLSRNIDYWKEKYDTDMANIEDRILSLKHFKQQQLKKLNELEEVYNAHQKEMDEFLNMKEERRRKEEKEALEHANAVLIQSWWRGLMVRRCLGQFRRRKKAVKDTKAKKKRPGKSPKATSKK
ncbi:hypothetical protein J437_LFUL010699 [Ladona fulva]|uniref:Dynein regulatory complex protein 9 n=1 Tax=Ladona fulva TaxID=123851 RepID=A0A8K0KEW5_LADFU|nr:hypothetical protein J437_LFUL010699 [Ladona fulva]